MMSEYQYYEFVAIDRPLTRDQMAELRAISSRAEITTTRFTNEYNYGDFRGDPTALIEHYFDAHVYIANWGTHILMFGLPATAVNADALLPYRGEDGFSMEQRDDRLILTLQFANQDGEDVSDDDYDGSGWMGSLVSLRADLLAGDLRAAYLGWLRGIQSEYGYEFDEEIDEEPEYEDAPGPPIPAGLGALSASLERLVEFLELDPDLVAVAAEASAPLTEWKPSTAAMRAWVNEIPASGKDALLLRVLQGDTRVQAELFQRFRQETAPESAPAPPGQTPRQLLEAAAARRTERTAREAEAREREQKRRAEEATLARERHLRSLAGQEPRLWANVEQHIASKQQKEYDRAVEILVDLRDLARRAGTEAQFAGQVSVLRERHRAKPSLIKRLDNKRMS